MTPDKSSSADTGDAQFQVSPPSISLPKGGGAISGIGEKFSANPVTGTGSMSVPIATSPGRGGFGPQLALSYDSGSGNGPFGFGWSLGLPQITRKTDKGLPQYQDALESDVFVLSGAEDLVPVTGSESGAAATREVDGVDYHIRRYRPRIEGLFASIERWTRADDPHDVHWRSISRENILTLYGRDAESRIFDPEDPGRIFSWLISESRDDKGNAILYRYRADDGTGVEFGLISERNRGDRDDPRRTANRYIYCILYGNRETQLTGGRRPPFLTAAQYADDSGWLFEVKFDYHESDHEPESAPPLPDDTVGEWSFRRDPFSSYRAGFEVRTTRLCHRVLMLHHIPPDEAADTATREGYDGLVRVTKISYRHAPDVGSTGAPAYSFVHQVGHITYRKNGSGYDSRSLPPVEFTYSQARFNLEHGIEDVDPTSLENLPVGLDGTVYQWTDLHGEGISGILTEQGGAWFYKRNHSPLNVRVETNHVNDMEVHCAIATFASIEPVTLKPAAALAAVAQFMDLAGDGQPDLVLLDGPAPGFYEHDTAEGWLPFRPLESRLNHSMRDPNLRFIDLDGDGHADVLITGDEVFIWHASLAESGFGPARRVIKELDEDTGPRIVFADGTQSIYLADMSGDGLTDLVRIRCCEISYWPNLGHGRFGAKITMDNAPCFDNPDQFDHRRIRTADIDGTGTIDIIYLHRDGVRLYFNQSGNGWSEARQLDMSIGTDNLTSVMAVDLLGNGTACLVWSSPLPGESGRQMRYASLTGHQKPHLLVRTRNNLGAETEVRYAPSTKFYLADKLAGKPWITRLPFPVHVVEQVTVRDKWRKTTFTTTYSYHHGYFDGEEREFRGFGRVEQVDVEAFDIFAAGNTDSPWITDDLALYQPPVKTVSWFHTGAFLDRERILSRYEHEYFPSWFEAQDPANTNIHGAFRENALPEPDLDAGDLTADEWREALRACKGMLLRQEVYELDVDAMHERGEQLPVRLFSTAYHNCHIRCLQRRGTSRHAVFLATESEAISYHYELDLRSETLSPDPRIAHTLNLNIDDYGNVLQSAAVVYPRIGEHPADGLEVDDVDRIRAVQQETHLAYTETHYTNDVNEPADPDNYRLRVPCEVLSCELTGISPVDVDDPATPDPRENRYFTLNELRRLRLSTVYQPEGEPVTEIGYHQIADGSVQKRCVEHVRTLFFDDSPGSAGYLAEPLPFRTQGVFGLPFENYKLALTDALLDAVFTQVHADGTTVNRLDRPVDSSGPETVRGRLGNAPVSGYLSGTPLQGRFESEVTTGEYWIRSGIAGFADDADDHFYLPELYTDAFGNTTTLDYDDLDLYIRSSSDPLGNTVRVRTFDSRVLSPRVMEDINGNVTEAAFDTLGLPAMVAVKGKDESGDTLEGVTRDIIDPAAGERAAFFTGDFDTAAARRLLATATARHLYYFGETVNSDGEVTVWAVQPPCAAAILRERHGETDTPLQVAYEYSDGGGNVLVKKVQAEPEYEGGPRRWIRNGLTILNNKGKPVKQYEPDFTFDHRFEEPVMTGVTPVMYYDAPGRLVRTELPDGSFSRVEFTPWHVTSYDPGDTVLESDWYRQNDRDHFDPGISLPTDPAGRITATPDQRAGWLAARHAGTPAVTVLDSLGREVIAIAHNRVEDASGEHTFDGRQWRDETYGTFTRLDAEGKPLWIRDARGNLVMRYIRSPTAAVWDDEDEDEANEDIPADSVPCYDIAGNLLFQHSMDAGDRWMLNDAAGQPLFAWDFNERITDAGETVDEQRVFHTTYDELRRPREHRLRINAGDWLTVERFVYGEGVADAAARNLRGQLMRHYDPAGLITSERFDFKGNLLETRRRLAADVRAPVLHWPDDVSEAGLEAETFTKINEYDALNRMTRLYNWHRSPEHVAVYEPKYNERGVLRAEELMIGADRTRPDTSETPPRPYTAPARKLAVSEITYNAKGQRVQMMLGNNTRTRYEYDDKTFRLVQLRTTRPESYDPLFPGHHSGLADERIIQQLSYTYDPAGNITDIYDEAYEPVFFDNQAVEPHSQYEYDALYRLTRADGREDASGAAPPQQRPGPWPESGFPLAPGTLRHYTQTWSYDRVGNIMQMRHEADGGNRTRHYAYADDSNRLMRTWTGSDTSAAIDYGYDTHGSMLNLDRVPDAFNLRWDYRDMIRHVNLGGGGQAWYNYDAGKQRTRKRIERIGGSWEERLYLGGMELYRSGNGSGAVVEEIESHHLFVDERRVLLVDDVLDTDDSRGAAVLYRYQYGNHLGSAVVELDGDAQIISYEEYHPYGTTAYCARNSGVRATAKRYRYTGMERDEETGLSYHTARFYASWLGRWASADPVGIQGALNIYSYASNRPFDRIDRSGRQDAPVEQDFLLSAANWLDRHGVDDFAAGFGDILTGGLTADIRQDLGVDQSVNYESGAYYAGELAGVATGSTIGFGQMAAAGTSAATAARVIVGGAAAVEGVSLSLDVVDPSGRTSRTFGQALAVTGLAVSGSETVASRRGRTAGRGSPVTRAEGRTAIESRHERQRTRSEGSNVLGEAGATLEHTGFGGFSKLLAEMHAHDLAATTPGAPSKNLPRVATVIVDIITGQIFSNTSGRLALHLDVVTGAWLGPVKPNPSSPLIRSYGAVVCAEPQALFVPDAHGIPRANLEMSSVHVRPIKKLEVSTGDAVRRCSRCAPRTHDVGSVPTD